MQPAWLIGCPALVCLPVVLVGWCGVPAFSTSCARWSLFLPRPSSSAPCALPPRVPPFPWWLWLFARLAAFTSSCAGVIAVAAFWVVHVLVGPFCLCSLSLLFFFR